MKKIMDTIKQHKVMSSVIVAAIVSVVTIVSVVAFQHQQTETIKKEQTQALEQSKAIAQKLIENEKEVVKDDEEAVKLQNQLQQAINENDTAKIETLKNQLVAKVVALNTAKAEKQEQEEKAEAIAKDEEEKKKEEEAKQESETTQDISNSSNVASNNSSVTNSSNQTVKKEQPKQTTLVPQPKKEEPKQETNNPNKYCTYTGNRQRVKNICMYGNANKTEGYVSKMFIGYVNNGMIDKIVWKDEPERYYLLEETGNQARLLEGLKRPSTPANAYCFVNGSCIGFDL